tara:strand:+ start:760 stop:924 length:165 start_codon:yes stop_codon:yes gene_type:complete
MINNQKIACMPHILVRKSTYCKENKEERDRETEEDTRRMWKRMERYVINQEVEV